MPGISSNIISLQNRLSPSVKLVAVSKTRGRDEILEAYNAGQRIFGENRVQELLAKKDLLPPDIEWHMIGHLQSNKVKFIAPFISMIQSVDSSKLLRVINAEAAKNSRTINCLLQFHIAEEETKSGFSARDATEMLGSSEFRTFTNVRICGVMGMATFTNDLNRVRREFNTLRDIFNSLKQVHFTKSEYFAEISMGMSGDFELAIEEGSTMVRLGSIIFGNRN
jgi:hypothetical protein